MVHTRRQHWQFLEEELRAQTETYKQKLDTKAISLLRDREELFVAQFLALKDGELILKFSNTRGLPSKVNTSMGSPCLLNCVIIGHGATGRTET